MGRADGARYFIDEGAGNRQVSNIIEVSHDHAGSGEIVRNAEGEPIGESQTYGTPTLTLTIAPAAGEADPVDWEAKFITQERFDFHEQLVSGRGANAQYGKRTVWRKCKVSNHSGPRSKGNVRETVQIIYPGGSGNPEIIPASKVTS